MRAVNLLPPDLRTATRRGKGSGTPAAEAPGGKGPFAVLGALAMCVIALAGYVLAGNTIEDRRVELAAVTAEHEATTRQAAALKPYADFQSLAKTRVEGVKALAAVRFDWHRVLEDLSRAIPTGVTLQALNGSATASATPTTGTAAAVAPTIDLTGCTTGDDAVAKLMSSLGTIRGVTRVSLTNASRANAGAENAEADTPCGSSASNFSLKIAFERAVTSVPAAGAAATTAAATTASTTTATTSEGTTAR